MNYDDGAATESVTPCRMCPSLYLYLDHIKAERESEWEEKIQWKCKWRREKNRLKPIGRKFVHRTTDTHSYITVTITSNKKETINEKDDVKAAHCANLKKKMIWMLCIYVIRIPQYGIFSSSLFRCFFFVFFCRCDCPFLLYFQTNEEQSQQQQQHQTLVKLKFEAIGHPIRTPSLKRKSNLPEK